jgi:hypothetical protein
VLNPLLWPDRLLWPLVSLPTVVLAVYVGHEYGLRPVRIGLLADLFPLLATVYLLLRIRGAHPRQSARLRTWAAIGGAAAASVATLIRVGVSALASAPHHLGEIVAVPLVDSVLVGSVLIAIAVSSAWAPAIWLLDVNLVALGFTCVEAFDLVAARVPPGPIPHTAENGVLTIGAASFVVALLLTTVIAAGIRWARRVRGVAHHVYPGRYLAMVAIGAAGILAAAALGGLLTAVLITA